MKNKSQTITLDGESLTIEQVVSVAYGQPSQPKILKPWWQVPGRWIRIRQYCSNPPESDPLEEMLDYRCQLGWIYRCKPGEIQARADSFA